MIPKRIVLDTNVCLDLFVFHDPRWAELHQALRDGTVEAVTRHDCRTEWLIVLTYPHLPLTDESRIRTIAEFDSVIACIVPNKECAEIPLPVCRDPDDQKFLELSRDANADVLITKDKALLKLARRTAKAGLFTIMPPEAWVAYVQRPHAQQ